MDEAKEKANRITMRMEAKRFGYEKLDRGQTRVRVLIDLSCKKLCTAKPRAHMGEN